MKQRKMARSTHASFVIAVCSLVMFGAGSGLSNPVPMWPAAVVAQPAPRVAFDICLQDDADATKSLAFSSLTGAYQFCCGDTTFTGTGLVKVKGKVVTLIHYPADHKLVATINNATHRGTASLQFPHATVPCTIIDRNTQNDVCSCAE